MREFPWRLLTHQSRFSRSGVGPSVLLQKEGQRMRGSGGSPSRSEEDGARLELPAGRAQASSGRQLEVHSSGPRLVNNEWGLLRQSDRCVLGSHRAAPERLRGTVKGFQSEPEALGPGQPWPRRWGHCGWCRLPRGKGETLPCCSFSEQSHALLCQMQFVAPKVASRWRVPS